MDALYVSSNSFKVSGDETSEFITNRRVKMDCGVDGVVIASVVSSSYDTTDTTVVIDENTLTSNLSDVLYSVIKPGQDGNISIHTHSSSEGEGGEIDIPLTFTGLSDTPSTYSGTEGYYLQSTGSGTVWTTISGGESSDVESFLDLSDTPTTYSGLDGLYAQVSGTQIIFTDLVSDVFAGYVEPDENVGKAHSLYVDRGLKEVYYRESDTLDRVDFVDVKSVVIDITDNQGDPNFVGIRSVEFKFQGSIISLGSSDFTSYHSSSNSSDYISEYAFDTSKSKIDSQTANSWLSVSGADDNARLVCVFNEVQRFDEIVINNHHHIGSSVERGVKNVKIYTSSDTITSTVYGEGISSSYLIFDGQLDPHVALNVVDDQSLILVFPLAEGMWEKVTTYNDTSNFIDLEDTPTTYSGSVDGILRTTASGISFSEGNLITSASGVPEITTTGVIGDFYIDTHSKVIYVKDNEGAISGQSMKSVILDIAGNWAESNYSGIREVAFYYNDAEIPLTTSDFSAYATTEYSATYEVENVFDTSLSLIGSNSNTVWLSLTDSYANQRLIVVFNTPILFDKIVINNYHDSGTAVIYGVKAVKIYSSTVSVTDTTYGTAIPNSTLIFDGILDQHVESDVEDPQSIEDFVTGGFSGWEVIGSMFSNFTELSDTPFTYSGTEGYYLQSTGSGTIWTAISGTGDGTSDVESFLDLEDTPITYSGTEGYYLQSTGSGIEFLVPPANLYSSENAPTGYEDRSIGDFSIVSSEGVIYEKVSNISNPTFQVKSVILDIADTYGSTSYLGIRSIDFYYQNVLVSNLSSNNDFVAYATTYDSASFVPENAFDTALSKTGSVVDTSWYSAMNQVTNQRLICVFDVNTSFDKIVVNNLHHLGGSTDRGAKNVKIYTSTDIITDTTYNAAISNSTLIFDGQLDQHIASDVEDSQELVLIILVDTGWEKLLETKDNFLDLNDTPTTYSGGQYLISTSSGISYLTPPPIVYSSENAPTGLEEDRNIGDFNIVTSESSIYEKTGAYSIEAFIAKSVILDIADNWGDSAYLGLREVDFYFKGSKLTLTASDYTAQAPSYASTNYLPENIFDTSKNLTGDPNDDNNSWLGTNGNAANQRVSVVFNSEIVFDSIVVNNFHYTGSSTNRGAKNVKIYTSLDSIISTTYGAAISNGVLIFDDQFDEHISSDVVDSQELVLIYDSSNIVTGWDEILSVPQTLIDLEDTPITYSGTEGYYLQSTGSGTVWATISGGGGGTSDVESFLDLEDTPSTYSGTNGYYLKSTGSGIGFYTPPPVLYTSENIPTGLEEAAIGDFDIVTSEQSIYIKNRILTEGNISAKSVILDIADGWGSTILGVRSVDFMYSGEIIPNIATTNFVAYATTDLGTGYEPELSFDTSTSKLSGYSTNQWLSDSGASTNQRLICVFNSEIMFDSIVINNTHSNGAGTDQGSKNVKITVSTDTITDTTYNTSVSNSYVIFDGQFDEHVTSNVEDPQELSIQGEISDTGWDEVLAVSKNFTDLDDTPTTYSGTSGYLVKSTGSGLSFYTPSPVVYTSEDAPTGFEDATVGDFNIVNSDDTIYVRNRIATIEDVTAKSVILDIADNWGDPSFISIRSVDFFYGGELITNITSTDFVAYATTFHSSTYAPQYSFDTSKSKIGTLSGNQWLSLSSNITNQRLICVFNEATTFDEIVINNAHSYGDQVSRGSKNIKISFSTDEITDTTYNATISNSFVLFDGQLNQHITSDVEDPQTLDVYGEVTDSGWDELLKVSKSLLDLSDTPSTYSGAGGYYLISTSSGVIWELPTGRIVDNVTPDYFTEGNVGDFIINGTDRSIHEKNREGSIEGTTARSVIFDIADVWGGASTGIRSIWFYNDDELVVTSDTNADAYATNSNGSGYAAILAFDTSLPKIGAAYDNSWQSIYSSDQRLIIVFNNTITFDQIIVNNYHDSGTWTNKGAKNVKIYATPSVYTDTTFEAVVTSGTLLFDDQFTQHPATNIVADELITLPDFTIDTGWDEIISFPNNLIGLIDGETDPTIKTYDIDTYYISKESSTIFKLNDSPTASGIIGNVKSVIFDIADNYGNGYNIGIRAVEFAKDGVVWPLTTTDSVAYATTYYDIEWAYPINVFDTTLLKTGDYNDVDSAGWLSDTYQTTNQRLIVVFNNSLDFDEIIINNAHSSGSNTNWGAENVVVTVSTSEITDTTYAAAIENASVVFDGQFAEHVASDVVDDQSITLTVPTTEEFIFRTWDSVFEAPTSFIALEDTPTTYSGGGQYLRTTTSGIEAIDGIILKAPNNSEWLLQVTNSGTLYTVEV